MSQGALKRKEKTRERFIYRSLGRGEVLERRHVSSGLYGACLNNSRSVTGGTQEERKDKRKIHIPFIEKGGSVGEASRFVRTIWGMSEQF